MIYLQQKSSCQALGCRVYLFIKTANEIYIAVAFGASFAFQGFLANYGAGLTIILTRSFVVGNTITMKGVSGVVAEVNLGTTVLTDEDGVKITIPNKHIAGEIILAGEEGQGIPGGKGFAALRNFKVFHSIP